MARSALLHFVAPVSVKPMPARLVERRSNQSFVFFEHMFLVRNHCATPPTAEVIEAEILDQPDLRLSDLRFVIELIGEACAQEKGARDRVAAKYGVRKSVITDRVDRIEAFVGVALFAGPQRKTPTAAGRELAKRGPQFLALVADFVGMLRDTEAYEDRRENR